MKRISTFFEIIVSATLLLLGLYLLYEGSSNKSATAAVQIGGAVCCTLSVMTLVSAVKSILWHRRMLRHSMSHHDPDTSAAQHNHGQ